MGTPRPKTPIRRDPVRRGRTAGQSALTTTALFIGPGQTLSKGTAGFKLMVPKAATKALAGNPKRMEALLQGYGDAITKSRAAGRRVSFRVDVDPEGETVVTPFEEADAAAEPVVEEVKAPDPELQAALDTARARGRLRAAEILGGDDMLSAAAFAEILGTTRMTVNTKRQSGIILGLDGAKRGFRFPVWQLDAEGKPYAGLAALHERLGGPWAVYRFLVQPHGELGGLSGREALERGKVKTLLKVAESVGRDFR